MMAEKKYTAELLGELTRLAEAVDNGGQRDMLDLDRLPEGDREAARLFNRIMRAKPREDGLADDQQAMLKSILNGMEALITVCDLETFEILFINDSIRRYFDIRGDGVGQLCYKLLQKLDAPCPTCPYQKLLDAPDDILEWMHREVVKGSILRKTARIIDWADGKKAHLEYAIDITDAVKTREALERREKMLSTLNRVAISLLAHNEDTFMDVMTAGIGLLADIVSIDRMSVSRNVERPDGLYASQIYRWSKRAGSSIHPIEELQENSYDRHIPRWRDVLSTGKCIVGPVRLMPEGKALAAFGCVSVLAIPIFITNNFWGFALYENLFEEREFLDIEIEMLRAASFMMANTIIRHEETQIIRQAEEQLKQMLIEMEYQNLLLYTVNNVSAILLQSGVGSFDLDIHESMGIIAETVDADRVYIWENFTHEGELYCRQAYEWSEGDIPPGDEEAVQQVSYREIFPGWENAFREGKCINGIVRKFSSAEYGFIRKRGVVSILVVPIYLRDRFWGFVGFDDCHKERVFSENEEKILRSASELIANALIRNGMEKNIQQLEVEVDKIYTDPLTGIYNRRYFDETLARLMRTLSRPGGEISLMMIDIDRFKEYNDTYGHIAGDECLKVVAKTLRDSVTRADDFAARYGGEEFVIVLPNTNEVGARMMARKLLDGIRGLAIPHEKSDAAEVVTVSIGVMTGKVDHLHKAADYVQLADKMLYKSKQSGRNKYLWTGI